MAVFDYPERLICRSGILCSSREELTGASLSRPRSSRGRLRTPGLAHRTDGGNRFQQHAQGSDFRA
jgi:hypothetical protein